MSTPPRFLSRIQRHSVVALALLAILPACFDFEDYALRSWVVLEDGGLYPPFDAPPPETSEPCTPAQGEVCSILPHCGCLESNVCDVANESGSLACIANKGLKLGDKCGGLFSGCGPGLTCVEGLCKTFCRLPRDCGENSACYQVYHEVGGVKTGIPGMKVCSNQCNFLKPKETCGEGVGCFPLGRIGVQPAYSACKVAGTSKKDCQVNEDCAPGLGCGEDLRCHPWCRYLNPLDCTPPQVCSAISDGEIKDYYYLDTQAYGICK